MRKKTEYLFTATPTLRIFFSIIIFLCGYYSYAQLPLGENPGYYGTQYTDQQLYDLMYAAGARSTRSSVPVQYDLTYGMATFQARLQYPYSTKGMRNNTFFLFASPGPTYSTESTKKTAGGHQSWLPAGIYNAPFNSDGTINTANSWAKYIYDVMQSVGPYFTYYEVWNEPDLTNSSDSYNDSTVSKTSWQIVEPTPDELTNMYDSLESYVQLCKIANQVVKKYQPAAKICTGGIGYQWFYQWFLRKGGGQWVDELSFHEYPYYDWCYCAWTGTTCGPAGFHRNSDYAANAVLAELQSLRQIETNEKGAHLPAMMTETNIPRWSYVPSGDMEVFPQNRPWGTDRTQRNFTIKVFAKMMLAGLNSFYFYQTGETGDSGLNNGSSGSEIDAMGMYKNLQKATVGKEVLTSHGLAIRTMQTLLGNYKVDGTQPTLPSGVDGVRFDSSGNKIYILWAITTLDTLETASGSFTLPSGTFKKYLYDGSSPGTASGTVALTGDPLILIQNLPASSVSCNAGTNQTITLPATATLDASASIVTNSTISSYSWTQIAGQNSATIANAKTVTTTASFLVAGSYTFQVVVKDANGDSCTGSVQVTVKAALTPPTVNAGLNQTITFPATASLVGTATDATGTITSTVWSEVSGPDNNATFTNGNTLAATAKNLSVGTYTFQLTVTDNNNLSASSAVTVTVNPLQPPVVSAGSNQTITLPAAASLVGTATDAGTITNIFWTEVSGPDNTASFANANALVTTVNNLSAGTYTLQLTVTDNNNLSASATVNVTVNPPNQPPVVNAGLNQTITFPATASLVGVATDATGIIISTVWSEVSGPDNNAIFTNGNTLAATAKNLSVGTYTFQLTVTDNNNLSAFSQVTITVNPLNQPPVVNAGSNQTIYLPSSASLAGTATDATGSINNIAWSEVSGPDNNASFTAGNSLATTVNNLSAGTYIFNLTVTDNNNLSASSQVTITVSQPVAVNAGTDQTIILPTNSVTLSGTANDITGTISNYTWSEVSGPSTVNMPDLSLNNTTINGLVPGTYIFQLTATDNNNFSASSTVTITVSAL
ncbi:MAG TPA: Ig-like domain-containing protein, partial [Puia sp.]|nr:Ig-like domain-containing protein [Puia sp.]